MSTGLERDFRYVWKGNKCWMLNVTNLRFLWMSNELQSGFMIDYPGLWSLGSRQYYCSTYFQNPRRIIFWIWWEVRLIAKFLLKLLAALFFFFGSFIPGFRIVSLYKLAVIFLWFGRGWVHPIACELLGVLFASCCSLAVLRSKYRYSAQL